MGMWDEVEQLAGGTATAVPRKSSMWDEVDALTAPQQDIPDGGQIVADPNALIREMARIRSGRPADTQSPPLANRMPDAPPGISPVMQPPTVRMPGTPGPIVIKDAPQAKGFMESMGDSARDAIPFLGIGNRGADNKTVADAISLYNDARSGQVNPGKDYGEFDPTNTRHWEQAAQIVQQWATEQVRPTTLGSEIGSNMAMLPAMAVEFRNLGIGPSTIARGEVEAQNRQLPKASRDPKTGEITLTPTDESPEMSKLKGYGSAFIESLTERLGLGIGKKIVNPVVSKIPKLDKAVEGVANSIRRLVQDEGASALLRVPAKALTASGKVIQDPISEYLEEYTAANLRAAFNIEDGGLEGDANTLANRLAKSLVPDLRTMAVTMAVSSVPMAGRAGLAFAGRKRPQADAITEVIAQDPALQAKVESGERLVRKDMEALGIKGTNEADRDAAAESWRQRRQQTANWTATAGGGTLSGHEHNTPSDVAGPTEGDQRVDPNGLQSAQDAAVVPGSTGRYGQQRAPSLQGSSVSGRGGTQDAGVSDRSVSLLGRLEIDSILRSDDIAARRPVLAALFPDYVLRDAPEPDGGDFSVSLWGEYNEPGRWGPGRVPFPAISERFKALQDRVSTQEPTDGEATDSGIADAPVVPEVREPVPAEVLADYPDLKPAGEGPKKPRVSTGVRRPRQTPGEKAVTQASKAIQKARKSLKYGDIIHNDNAYVALLNKYAEQQAEGKDTIETYNELQAHRRKNKYKDPIPMDPAYLGLIGQYQAARKKEAGERAAVTRKENTKKLGVIKKDLKAGNITPAVVEKVPVHELPDALRQKIQAEAAFQITQTESEDTKTALQKIIDDNGVDTGADVAYQKKRLLGILTGERQQDRAEKNIGYEQERPADPIVDLYIESVYEEGKGSVQQARSAESRAQLIEDAMRSIEEGEPNELANAAYERVEPGYERPLMDVRSKVMDLLETMGKTQKAEPIKAKGILKQLSQEELADLQSIEVEFGNMLSAGPNPRAVILLTKAGMLYAKAGARSVKAFVKQILENIPSLQGKLDPAVVREAYRNVVKATEDKTGFEDIDSLSDTELMRLAGVTPAGGNGKPAAAATPVPPPAPAPSPQGTARQVPPPPPADAGVTGDRPLTAAQASTRQSRSEVNLLQIVSPASKSDVELLAEARAEGIVDDAVAISTMVLRKWRSLSDAETVGLNERRTQIEKEYKALVARVEESFDDGAIQRMGAKMEELRQNFDIITQALDRAGTEQGRAFRARRLYLDDTTNELAMLGLAKANKGSELTEDERMSVRAAVKEAQRLQAKIDELLEENKQLITKKVFAPERIESIKRMPQEARLSRMEELRKTFKDLADKGCG